MRPETASPLRALQTAAGDRGCWLPPFARPIHADTLSPHLDGQIAAPLHTQPSHAWHQLPATRSHVNLNHAASRTERPEKEPPLPLHQAAPRSSPRQRLLPPPVEQPRSSPRNSLSSPSIWQLCAVGAPPERASPLPLSNSTVSL